MKKTIIGLNVVLIMAILIGDICYMEFGGLALKGTTSFGFVLLGAVNLFYAIKTKTENLRFPIVMLVGLTFAMLGDIFINIDFISGALLFAVGHVFYFVSFCCLSKFKPTDLIPSAVIFVASTLVITLTPIFDFGGLLMEMVCIVYAFVISLMFGKAISNLIRSQNTVRIVLAVGCFLFFFSDLMLVFDVFADVPHIISTLCLATYYPAQCLLALSSFLAARDGNT